MELEYILEDKHADIEAQKEDGSFSYAWQLEDETKLFVEYIPGSCPALMVGTTRKPLDDIADELALAGFDVNY